ncbi:pkaR, partial [Symbiodinium sp. CCMP2456]
ERFRMAEFDASRALQFSSGYAHGALGSGATSGDDLAFPVVPPPPASAHLTNRRGGVSAEPAGANNVRWAEWTAPFYRKSEEHRIKLLCAVRTCPIFQGVEERDLHTIVDAIEVVSFQPRDTIYTKGEYGRSGFVLISGQVIAEAEDVDQSDNIFRRSKSRWVTFEEGQFFGEHTMLWGFTRRVTMTTSEGCVVGKLRRDAYFNIVTRSAMRTRSLKEKYLRQVPIFETFDDELIIRITDIVEKRTYAQGQKIIKQGEEIVQAGQSVSKGENVPAELYILLSGQCEASIMVDVVGGNKKEAEEQAVREYKPGQRFGELGFIHRKTRAANVTAKTEVELLVLDRDTFERLVELELKQRENYACDPRKALADFWSPGSHRGPRGIEAPGPSSETHWFAVYRPTSRDALAKMLNQTAVGKGLNVKGKSAKRNRLSGFVPFLQIHDNADKNKIENPPPDAFVTIYYDSKQDREIALQEMRDAAAIGGTWTGGDRDHAITLDDSYPDAFGARVPETLMRMVYIDKQDIQFQAGWETGRHSEPAFMDMNLHAVRDEKSNPRVVLYQYDATNPMNPHGLLIAYAEEWTAPHSSKVVRTVKPVVSDFDTFTVGSKGMRYERLPPDQMELELWSLDRTREILSQPNSDSWTSRWLKVLSEAAKQGRKPEVPPYGFGDPTSYGLIEQVIKATQVSGAVRHGAECFNFLFPQELDSEYLIVWHGFSGKPWEYHDQQGLLKFLRERIAEGYCFPLNPVWPVRDPGWYEVYSELVASQAARSTMACWFPEDAMSRIESMHQEFPEGFHSMESSQSTPPGNKEDVEQEQLRLQSTGAQEQLRLQSTGSTTS